ncbi:helix-turn-helix domain-containing protein [Bombella apis]|uniref:helix-turn-helix domain-containing protein n=1 Tax=Bombella apis TaxID=1785988 RepID=UPI0024A953BA|nr:helix-turn-helix transcriptional regulator [Bombella apis]
MTALHALKNRLMQNEDFAREYNQADAEYSLLEEMVSLRNRAHLTQEEVARRMKTSQSAVARLEAGNGSPTIKTLKNYARAVGSTLVIRFSDGHRSAS